MTQAVIQTTVTGMQGRPISATAPVANQAYTWSGSAWTPTGPFLPLAGGILSGPLRLQFGAADLIFNDTATSITAGGLWRAMNNNGTLVFQSNTATAGDFSTANIPLTLNANGTAGFVSNVSVGGTLNTTGAATFNTSVTVGGSLLVTGTNVLNFGSGIATIGAGTGGSTVFSFQPGTGYSLLWNGANGQLQYQSPSAPGTNAFIAFANGNFQIAGTLTQGSDATYKTNIAVLTQGISLVRQLSPKSFARTTTPTVTEWGFIAQDVEGVVPVAVSSTSESDGTTMLSLNTTAILAAVTMAVKQLDQRCTALEAHDGITPSAGELA